MDHANLRRPIHAVRPDLEILLDLIFTHVVPILMLATILTGNYRLLQKEENIPCPALKINYQNTNENHLTSKLPYGLRLKAKICKNFNITCPRHLQKAKEFVKTELKSNQDFLQKMEFRTLTQGLIFQPYKILITNIFLAGTIPKDKCEENSGYNSDQILEEFMEYEDRQFLTICAFFLMFFEFKLYIFYLTRTFRF